MEPLAYLYLAIAYEASPDSSPLLLRSNSSTCKPFTWQRFSGQAALYFLTLLYGLIGSHAIPPAVAARRGDRGSEVSEIQKNLAAAGYFNARATGFYGELTEAAVIRFQRANGLTPDGIVGTQTISALRNRSTSSQNAGSTNGMRGKQGTDVAELQRQLAAAGYFNAKATGFYGLLTEDAVTRFQRANGLTPDGIAGPQTLAKLRNRVPSGQNTSSTNNGVLSRGKRGPAVTQLQNSLKASGSYNGPTTGYFGSMTEAAVKRFQAANGLTADGKAGPRTLSALSIRANSAQSFVTISHVSRSDDSVAFATIQSKLKASGYYSGAVDGVAGPRTQAAVRQFQRDQGLTPDGVVGKRTLAALMNDRSKSPSVSSIGPGANKQDVLQLQRQLKCSNFDPGQIDGVYGNNTKAAVKRLQQIISLPANGIADPKTRSRLKALDECSNKVNQTSANGEPTLKDVQRRVIENNYNPGELDGKWGNQT